MISLIICSRNIDISNELKLNIQTTIGVEYEIIAIDNSQNKYTLFSAYNEGVKLANFAYLCFMHNDITFHTENWGYKIIKHFENQNVGLIGVLGSHFMPKTPSGWYFTHLFSGGVYQRIINEGVHQVELIRHMSFLKDDLSIEAVVVDGLWFCIPKSMFSTVFFDTNTFNGFHCYDLDICFQIRNAGLQVRIVSDILIEHFSSGSIDIDWINDSIKLFDKWQDHLPQMAGVELSSNEVEMREVFVKEVFSWVQQSKSYESKFDSNAYRLGKLILKPFRWFNLFNSINGKR